MQSIDIYSNGIIGLKTEINGKIMRTTFIPGQDVSGQPDAVRAVCQSVWTPEVVSAYEASVKSA